MPANIPNALLTAVKNRECVLFAGAGISYEALKIGAIDLRDALGAEIRDDHAGYDYSMRSLEDVCGEYLVLNDRPTLVTKLASLIPQNTAPLASHVAASRLFRFVVTTNWDLLFEAGIREVGARYQILMEEADAPLFSFDQHNLLKIHGSIDRPRSLICTSNDYEGYAETHPQLLQRVEELIYNNTILFVGHGLRDEHLRRLLSKIRRDRGEFQRRSYVVGFYDEVRTLLLESRQMNVIAEDASIFLQALVEKAA